MASVNLEEKLRYGISALDLLYREHALNDELMVDGSNGKMHYKRENDGQIVSYETNEYNNQTLVNDIQYAVNKNNTDIPTSDDDFIVYNSIDITGKNDALDHAEIVLEKVEEYRVSKTESAFFVRIRGNRVTNTCMNFVESYYNDVNPTNEIPSVLFTFNVTEEGTGKNIDITVKANFNELVLVKLTKSSDSVTGFKIKLKSFTFSLLKSAYNNLKSDTKTLLKSLNYGNEKFEASAIDIVTYTDDISNPKLYNSEAKSKLELIVPVKNAKLTYLDSEGFIVSSDKPTHKCIWGKIINN